MTFFGWAALIVCGAVLVLRLPDAIRGRNRTVFAIVLLATLASLLRIPEGYRAIDDMLGGSDTTVLLHRYIAFTAMFLVGWRVTRGLTDERGQRLITGPVGRWVLGLSCLALAVTFFLMDSPGPGELPAAESGGGQDAALVRLYAAAGHAYPAFVSLVLMPPLLALIRTRLSWLVRAGALLMFVGALAGFARLPVSLAPQDWDMALSVLTHTTVLGYILGFTAFWFLGLTSAPRTPRAALRTDQPSGTSPGRKKLRSRGG